MARCGVCNEHYGDLLVRHGEVCDDDSKAPSRRYLPEVDDIIKQQEEDKENG